MLDQKDIITYIKENGPVTRAQLCARFKMSPRAFRAWIHDQNLSKIPIVSSGKGFHYAKTRADAEAGARRLASQAKHMLHRASGILKTDVKNVVRTLF